MLETSIRVVRMSPRYTEKMPVLMNIQESRQPLVLKKKKPHLRRAFKCVEEIVESPSVSLSEGVQISYGGARSIIIIS